MAIPNIFSLSTQNLKALRDVDVAATPSVLLANSAASNKSLMIISLIATNIDGAVGANLTVDHYRSSIACNIAYEVPIFPGSPVVIIDKNAPVVLEEGDDLRLTASNAGDISVYGVYIDNET